MTVEELIAICSRFERMGGSVVEQAVAVVVDGEPLEWQNANALDQFAGFLRAVRRETNDADALDGIEPLLARITAHVAERRAGGQVVRGEDDD